MAREDFKYDAPEFARDAGERCRQHIRLGTSDFLCARRIRDGGHSGMHDADIIARDGRKVRW
jgi:hypothetical protein